MTAANESWVLRFFGVKEADVCRAASGLAGRCGLVQIESRSQGPETLLALTAPASALRKAEDLLRRHFHAGLYGAGNQTLADSAAQALVRHDRLLACADPAALELLVLPGRPGGERRPLAAGHHPAGCGRQRPGPGGQLYPPRGQARLRGPEPAPSAAACHLAHRHAGRRGPAPRRPSAAAAALAGAAGLPDLPAGGGGAGGGPLGHRRRPGRPARAAPRPNRRAPAPRPLRRVIALKAPFG